MATITTPRPQPSSATPSQASIATSSEDDKKLEPPIGGNIQKETPRPSGSRRESEPGGNGSTSSSSPQLNGDQIVDMHQQPPKRPGIGSRLSRMFSHKGDTHSQPTPNVPKSRDRASSRTSYFDTDESFAEDENTSRKHSTTDPAVDTLLATPNGAAVVDKINQVGHSLNGATDSPAQRRRFMLQEDGAHEHTLKPDKRQETLTNMFKQMFTKKGDVGHEEHQLSLVSSWVDQVKSEKTADDKKGGPNCADTLVEKYGKCSEVVGRGAFGIVRISHKADYSDPKKEQLYAVKEFRRRPSESPKKYNKRLTSEFCISSALRHPNVIHTLDLMKDAKGDFCEVMEYCAGGDLYTLVLAAQKLEVLEADCFFKQLMRGVEYIHEMGVSHRDLKPENLLLTSRGSLKITDFGNGECFRMAWEKEPHMVAGLCGSAPYISPEEYHENEFDPRAVDVWACGVIYMAMRTGRHLWRMAKRDEDDFYDRYCEGRKSEEGYGPIESLHRARCRNVVYSILDPNPRRRITATQILKSHWCAEIKLCRAGDEGL